MQQQIYNYITERTHELLQYIHFPCHCTTLCFNVIKQDISYYKLKPKFKKNDYPDDLVQTALESTLYIPKHRSKQNKIILCVGIFQNNFFHFPLVLNFFFLLFKFTASSICFSTEKDLQKLFACFSIWCIAMSTKFVFMTN